MIVYVTTVYVIRSDTQKTKGLFLVRIQLGHNLKTMISRLLSESYLIGVSVGEIV